MTVEMWSDALSRLESMAKGDGDWDLSDNDRAAIRGALVRLDAATAKATEAERELAGAEAIIAEQTREDGAVVALQTRAEAAEARATEAEKWRDFHDLQAQRVIARAEAAEADSASKEATLRVVVPERTKAEAALRRMRAAAQAVVDAYDRCRAAGSIAGFWTHLDDLAAELDGRADNAVTVDLPAHQVMEARKDGVAANSPAGTIPAWPFDRHLTDLTMAAEIVVSLLDGAPLDPAVWRDKLAAALKPYQDAAVAHSGGETTP